MKLTTEQLLAIKNAASAEELTSVARKLGINKSDAYIEKTFNSFRKSGALADTELDNVAGGGCEISNGLWGCDHPGLQCPNCKHQGMDEEFYGGWKFECPECARLFVKDKSGNLVPYSDAAVGNTVI